MFEKFKIIVAITLTLLALVLVFPAWDWRSPFLVDLRSSLLAGLIGVPLFLMAAQAWLVFSSRPGQRMLRVSAATGLITAGMVLAVTLGLEARFHWVRYQVLRAEPARLERLGRHLIVGYRDLGEVQELIGLRAVGGVFVSGHNVRGKTIAQVRQEIRSFQEQRKEQGLSPLWIATDQEGGVVSRLSPPLTRLPGLSGIVKNHPDTIQRQQAVRQFGAVHGRELADLGVNLNFAPVVDVNHQIINPEDRFTRVYLRAISPEPDDVTQVAAWYCSVLEEAGVRCTLKHFPGLGRVFEDTHHHHANLDTAVEELVRTDWKPFRELMSRTNAFIMLGHVRLTEIDSENPASASPPVVAGLIRGQWKFDGVLITDNFSMLAVYRSKDGMDKGSIKALDSGVDLILISYDPDQYYRVMHAMLKADINGTLDREALKRSHTRLDRAMESMASRQAGKPTPQE